MEKSFNCCVIFSNDISDSFMIDVYREKNKRYALLNKSKFFLTDFKVGHIKEFILQRNEVDVSDMHKVKLWKTDVDEDRIKNEKIYTEDKIVNELSGKEMKTQA